MTTTGTVRVWHNEAGWGVIDSPATPGGCFAHFTHVIAPAGEFVKLLEGETVDFEWEKAKQDGFDYRARTVKPRRSGSTIDTS
jgi:CspA family cold shock protein